MASILYRTEHKNMNPNSFQSRLTKTSKNQCLLIKKDEMIYNYFRKFENFECSNLLNSSTNNETSSAVNTISKFVLEPNEICSQNLKENTDSLLNDYLKYLIDSLVEIYYQPMALWIDIQYHFDSKQILDQFRERIIQGAQIDRYFVGLAFEILKYICKNNIEPSNELDKLNQIDDISCSNAKFFQTIVSYSIELENKIKSMENENSESLSSSISNANYGLWNIKFIQNHLENYVKEKIGQLSYNVIEHCKIYDIESLRLLNSISDCSGSLVDTFEISDAKENLLQNVRKFVSKQIIDVLNQIVNEILQSFSSIKNPNELMKSIETSSFFTKLNSSTNMYVNEKCNQLSIELSKNLLTDTQNKSNDQEGALTKFKILHEKLMTKSKQSFEKIVLANKIEVDSFLKKRERELEIESINTRQEKIYKKLNHNLK